MKTKIILIVTFLFFTIYQTNVNAYPAQGLLRGKCPGPGSTSIDCGVSDGLANPYGFGNKTYVYVLDKEYDIDGYYLAMSGSHSTNRINFYDKNDNLIGFRNASTLNTDTNVYTDITPSFKNIKKIVYTGTVSHYLWDMDVRGNISPDTEPPMTPTGLNVTPNIESLHLTWNVQNEPDLAGYHVYLNNVKQNTTPIISTSYIITNVLPDTNYAITVSAIDTSGNESNKTNPPIYASAYTQIQYPNVVPSNVMHNSLRLSWENIGTSYEIYQDNVLIKNTSLTFTDITNLQPEILYQFKVISIDKYGRRNESQLLNVTTLKPPPDKPNITITNKTHNAFTITWQYDPKVTEYQISLNNNIQSTINTNQYTFTGLTPDTIYAFTVKAIGQNGDSITTLSNRTNLAPVPRIDNARVQTTSTNSGKLTYTPNEHVTEVKVYVNGNLIGTYPATQKEINLDFSEIQSTFADLRIVPTDPDSHPYEFKALTKSTGTTEIDTVIAKFLDVYQVLKDSFWYLMIAALPITLAVLIFFWLRQKFKTTFGETKKESSALINQPTKPLQERVDFREEKRKFIPWKEMTQEQKNEWRQTKGRSVKKPLTDAEKKITDSGTGFYVKDVKIKMQPIVILGTGGFKQKKDTTYERNGIEYKNRYVRGQGMVYQPNGMKNQIKHVRSQFNAVKSVLTGSNKKPSNGGRFK